MLGRTDRRLRHLLVIAFFGLFATALVGRLAYWQIGRGDWLQGKAAAQTETSVREPSERGDILDRRGTVLATTEYRDLLSAYPSRVPKDRREAVVEDLSAILGLDGSTRDRVADQLASGDDYVVLARDLSESQSERIREGLADRQLLGLTLEPKARRVYPDPGGAPGSTLASQLIGFVDRDGSGRYGIEERYQAVLAGQPRVLNALRDPNGRPLGGTEVVTDPGVPGASIRLTIDASLQLQVEKELYAAWVADKAKRVSAVVLDPDNGDVLAWASVPGYDANEYATVARTSASLFVDPIVSDMYEPGSVMKMFTATAAFEHGVVSPSTPILDTPSLQVGRTTIHNSDRRGKGTIPFADVVAYSRNVGTARVAAMLGKDVSKAAAVLYSAWAQLGIGQKTGVDVSNEVSGIAADPAHKKWAAIDLANRAFGQAVAVTPIQLATAFSTMANGGTRVQPHVLGAVDDEPAEPANKVQVLDPELAAELQDLMTHVVTSVPYYDAGTRMPGYHVGGKTGTAQIWDTEKGRWAWNLYNFSFAGFVGRDEPQAIIVARIHEARPEVAAVGDFRLGITSYELFRRIATDTVRALDIAPMETAPTTASAARP